MNSNDHSITTSQEIGSYYLDLARLASARNTDGVAVEDDEEREESPTELNTINSSGGFLVVSTDKLSVKYTSVNLHGHDVGVVQGNKPAPVKRLTYYFELYVKDAGSKGQIAIGFTTEGFKMRRQPGWEANSCGYHGDDGLLYRGQAKGEAFGPTYTTGDTVGGGINYAKQEFFFTKNGVVVGTVCKEIKGPLFPTLAVHSQNEEVQVNFGQKPFAFDLKLALSMLHQAFEAQERTRQQMLIEKIQLKPHLGYEIVRSYLLHYGYEDTLNSFDLASRSTVPSVPIEQENGFDEQCILYALNQRRTLRQLIRSGDINGAFDKLREWYPQIMQNDKSATCFLLHCQKFIELVRGGLLREAVDFGRMELAKFLQLSGFKEFAQDCGALLAFEQPENSFVGYLLEGSQRELVADSVNAMILSTNPKIKDKDDFLHSYLEKLLRQLTACCLQRRSLNGDEGEAFHLLRILKIRGSHKTHGKLLRFHSS